MLLYVAVPNVHTSRVPNVHTSRNSDTSGHLVSRSTSAKTDAAGLEKHSQQSMLLLQLQVAVLTLK